MEAPWFVSAVCCFSHLLAPSPLPATQTEELLMFAGVIDGSKESDKGSTGRSGRRKRGAKARAGHKTLDYNAEVDYHHLVDVMMW